MPEYRITGIEEVYDAWDDLENENMLDPISVESATVLGAIDVGTRALEKIISEKRKDCWSSGTFIPRVYQVHDDHGMLVHQGEGFRNT
jgi:hypothetical protein